MQQTLTVRHNISNHWSRACVLRTTLSGWEVDAMFDIAASSCDFQLLEFENFDLCSK